MDGRALLVVAVSLLAGCSDTTAPGAKPPEFRVEALVPLKSTGLRGTAVENLPAVKVAVASSGRPVSGKLVIFTLTTPLGTLENFPVSTDSAGVAKLPDWRLDAGLGLYTATAVTEGWGPVRFAVMVPGEAVAVYHLKTINGQTIPLGPTWGLEDHYILYESGLFNRFRNTSPGPFSQSEEVMGTYTRPNPDNIEFFLGCRWGAPPACFPGRVMATLRGAEMTIDESDEYGTWVQVYVLNPHLP